VVPVVMEEAIGVGTKCESPSQEPANKKKAVLSKRKEIQESYHALFGSE